MTDKREMDEKYPDADQFPPSEETKRLRSECKRMEEKIRALEQNAAGQGMDRVTDRGATSEPAPAAPAEGMPEPYVIYLSVEDCKRIGEEGHHGEWIPKHQYDALQSRLAAALRVAEENRKLADRWRQLRQMFYSEMMAERYVLENAARDGEGRG